jgi:hypothetical protein
MAEFSEYIVFVDETGDHGLDKIDASFPMFGLTFCIMRKDDYITKITPDFQAFKFKYWGHDTVVLHEHEMRKSVGPFSFLLTGETVRAAFFSDMSALMAKTDMTLISAVVNKERHKAKYTHPWNPYEVALMFCMERLLDVMRARHQRGKMVHVVFECRGKDEDSALELEFRRIVGGMAWGYRRSNFSDVPMEPIFAKKSANSVGLQLADLTARPAALRILRPEQENRAYDIVAPKMYVLKSFP